MHNSLRRKLHLKRLWLKHAWTFNWAHKPLCARFQEDVLQIGRARICRSCLLLYTGLAAGIVLFLVIGGPLSYSAVCWGLTLTAVTVVLSAPWWYKKWPRCVRDILRFALGLSIAFYLGLVFTGHVAIGIIGAVLMSAFWKVYLHLRADRKLRACQGCEQLKSGQICSGFAYQAEHIRRYEQEATEYVLAEGGVSLPTQKLTDKD